MQDFLQMVFSFVLMIWNGDSFLFPLTNKEVFGLLIVQIVQDLMLIHKPTHLLFFSFLLQGNQLQAMANYFNIGRFHCSGSLWTQVIVYK